jgi:hypothetical protein
MQMFTTATTTTTTSLTWDRGNGTQGTGQYIRIPVRDEVIWSDWNDREMRVARTITVDDRGAVIDHPRDLTARQKADAEHAWKKFLRDQPEQEQHRLQRERARNGNVNPLLDTQARYHAQQQAEFDAQQRRFDAEQAAWRTQHAADLAAQQAAMAKLRIENEAANKRAEKLLIENLSLKQAAEYAQHKHVIVHGRHARYRIRQGRSMNIDVIDREGKVTRRLCAYPSHTIPDCDTMLAQKLMLETGEDDFLKIAIPHQAILGPAVLPALQ